MAYKFQLIKSEASGYTPTVSEFVNSGGEIPTIEDLRENGITEFQVLCFDTSSSSNMGSVELSYDRIYLQFLPTQLSGDYKYISKAFQILRTSDDNLNPLENSIIPLFTQNLTTYYVYRPVMDEFVSINLSNDMRGLDSDISGVEEFFDSYFDVIGVGDEITKDVMYWDDSLLSDDYGSNTNSVVYKFKQFSGSDVMAVGFIYTGVSTGSIQKLQILYDELLSFYPVDTNVRLVNGNITPKDSVWYKYSDDKLTIYSNDNGIYKINYFKKFEGDSEYDSLEESLGVVLVQTGNQFGVWNVIDQTGQLVIT